MFFKQKESNSMGYLCSSEWAEDAPHARRGKHTPRTSS